MINVQTKFILLGILEHVFFLLNHVQHYTLSVHVLNAMHACRICGELISHALIR